MELKTWTKVLTGAFAINYCDSVETGKDLCWEGPINAEQPASDPHYCRWCRKQKEHTDKFGSVQGIQQG